MNALALEAPSWTEIEFADLDHGDARLNKRARTLMERLSAKPTVGVPQACQGWGETIVASRFFDNNEIEWTPPIYLYSINNFAEGVRAALRARH